MFLGGPFKRFAAWIRALFQDIQHVCRVTLAIKKIKDVANTEAEVWSIASFWNDAVAKHGERTALIYKNKHFTFAQVDKITNRHARIALASGAKTGTAVAPSMENSPEVIFWIFGLAKIGVPVALINSTIKGAGLAQCLKSCKAEWLIYSKEMEHQVASFSDSPESQKSILQLLCTSEMNDDSVSSEPIPAGKQNSARHSDAALHVFTSGTTGLPKAAKISHLRYYGSSLIFPRLLQLQKTDVLCCPLPLHHSSAIVLGLGLCLHNGIPFLFQKKFSTSSFWTACVDNKVTIIQHIAELCRYLTMAPCREEETKHSTRLALGNGLKQDVWRKFQQRFSISRVVEFYAASEANVGLVNLFGKVGAIRRLLPLIKGKFPGKLLRFDCNTGEPCRNAQGQCAECKENKVGEFVGMINPTDPTQRFDGYSDSKETEKKIPMNVLKVGDKCFRSGDLMTKDECGHVYFVDRIGDTFRWKGENVSTSQVESTLLQSGVKECSVYGICVDGCKGKAGVAQIKVDDIKNTPLAEIEEALSTNLPEHARLVFLLFTEKEIATTTTFKYQKEEFALQGLQPDDGSLAAEDAVLCVRKRHSNGAFLKMTNETKNGIMDGSIRL